VIESELVFLLQDEDVNVDNQARLLASGFYTFTRFALMGDTRPAVRLHIINSLLVASVLQQTLLVACWEVAKDKFAARSKLTAKAESTGLPQRRLAGDVKSLNAHVWMFMATAALPVVLRASQSVDTARTLTRIGRGRAYGPMAYGGPWCTLATVPAGRSGLC
jgi:hypothetical protein